MVGADVIVLCALDLVLSSVRKTLEVAMARGVDMCGSPHDMHVTALCL